MYISTRHVHSMRAQSLPCRLQCRLAKVVAVALMPCDVSVYEALRVRQSHYKATAFLRLGEETERTVYVFWCKQRGRNVAMEFGHFSQQTFHTRTFFFHTHSHLY